MSVVTRARPSPMPRAEQPRFRLRGRAHKLALTAHILTSVGWFGIAVAVAVGAITAASTSDPSLSRALYRAVEITPWLSIPVGLTAVATGVVLSLGTRFGLIRHWWVVAKIAISLAVIVTDAVVVAQLAHDAVLSGGATDTVYHGTIAHVVVLTIATVLSVFKPRGRTPWGRRREAVSTR